MSPGLPIHLPALWWCQRSGWRVSVGEHGATATAGERTRCLLSPRAATRASTASWRRDRDARCAPPTPPGSPSPAGRRFLRPAPRAAVPHARRRVAPQFRRHRHHGGGIASGEVNFFLAALVELGVQGLLIEQLRGLGLDEHLHLAVIDEGITGDRLGDERELEPLVGWRDAQPGALGGLRRQGADGVLGVIGQGKHGCSCSVGVPPDPPPSDGPRTMSNRAARPSACRGRRTIATRATLPWASWMPSTERSATPKNTSLTVSKPLPLNRSKDRTGAFARSQAPGGDNKSPRALVNAATELAHSVKRRSHLHAKRLGAPGMVRSGRDLRHQ